MTISPGCPTAHSRPSGSTTRTWTSGDGRPELPIPRPPYAFRTASPETSVCPNPPGWVPHSVVSARERVAPDGRERARSQAGEVSSAPRG